MFWFSTNASKISLLPSGMAFFIKELSDPEKYYPSRKDCVSYLCDSSILNEGYKISYFSYWGVSDFTS